MSVRENNSIVLLHGCFAETFYKILKGDAAEEIFVLEGRPYLTGAKITSAVLIKNGILPTIIADNMAGFLFYKNWVKEVWLAYQKVDKEMVIVPTGGLILAVLGYRHHVPVYAYPVRRDGKNFGTPDDILQFNGRRIIKGKIKAYVPLTEVVPLKYFSKIVDKNGHTNP